ncbi:MAG: adenylate/guanylate cyclase domain-containing protein, partial [Acidimicrobiales bacterium]
MAWVCTACAGENPGGTRFCGHCGTEASAGTTAAAEVAVDDRRLVTALFADLSGFTALADRLDADELHEVVAPVIRSLADVAEGFGGTVAKYAGDAILVFFGAPVAQEDHAVRALLAAIEMHRRLAADLPALAPAACDLELHVGVNSGRVIAGMFGSQGGSDYSILGDAVNLAQRLESVAPPGATYVGEATQALTTWRFDFESLGELSLKGKAKPVAAWRLIGERRQPPSSSAGTVGSSRPLVGRQRELRTITSALHSLAEGRGAVVGVTGEPGMGKSRLLAEVRGRTTTGGPRWLESRCVSYGAGLPYWPYTGLLRQFGGVAIDGDPQESVERLADSLRELGVDDTLPFFAHQLGLAAPTGASTVADLEPEAFRRGLHTAFAAWAAALAVRQTLVLAIEDLHWADPSSLELTRELAQLCREVPLVLILTARPGQHLDVETIATLAGHGYGPIIHLGPLDRSGAAALVADLLGQDPPAGLMDALNARASGNPFFCEEVVRCLQDADTLFRQHGAWRMRPEWDASALPPTIEDVISARIDLLPRAVAGVLMRASVVGRVVRLPLLAAISTDVADLDGSLDQLASLGFLDPVADDDENSVMIHHALVQDVAYSRLLRAPRREMHLRLAEAGEALYGSGDDVIELLARHLYFAEAGGRAVEYLVRAGGRSRRLFANDEAAVHLRRAAERAGADPGAAGRLPAILLNLADLQQQRGMYDEALRLYGEVRDATGDMRAWRGMAAVLRQKG